MDENYERAKRRVEELKRFYRNFFAFIIVNVFLAVVNLLTSPDFLWFLFITFFWGIGLLYQGYTVFSKRGVFSKEWEDRKIKEYMEKEK